MRLKENSERGRCGVLPCWRSEIRSLCLLYNCRFEQLRLPPTSQVSLYLYSSAVDAAQASTYPTIATNAPDVCGADGPVVCFTAAPQTRFEDPASATFEAREAPGCLRNGTRVAKRGRGRCRRDKFYNDGRDRVTASRICIKICIE